MKELKRVAAIHDISGFGKCSLTVALPIISAAGTDIRCGVNFEQTIQEFLKDLKIQG